MDHPPVFRAANIGTSFKTVRDAYGYYETLLGSRYRTFRIRKKLTLCDHQGSYQGHESENQA